MLCYCDMDTNFISIESIYDEFAPMLYSIALSIAPVPKDAEDILEATFLKIHKQNLTLGSRSSICAKLIKLVTQTAYEKLGPGARSIRVKHFEKTPLLHKLLCEHVSLETYCKENGISLSEGSKTLRQEHISMRLLKK